MKEQKIIVDVYRNLHNGKWSIRHKGKVINHSKYVLITPTKYHVGKGRETMLKTRVRQVHAWVKGELISFDKKLNIDNGTIINYRPYDCGHFFNEATKEPVKIEDFEFVFFDMDKKRLIGFNK